MKRLHSGWIVLSIFALLSSFRAGAQVSLYTAVDMALRNSTSVRMAQADMLRASAALTEIKDAYVPDLVLGSSLGYSYGFPLGEPSVFNVKSHSLLFAFSQPDYIRSARTAVRSAELNLKDTRDQAILDTALNYVQLDNEQNSLVALGQEKQYAEKLVSIEQDRVDAGVESRVELTKAQLTSAQIDLKRIHLEDDIDLLRQRLSHLTGLPADGFATVTSSIPDAPQFSPQSDLSQRVMTQNAGVQAADANAKSKMYISFGDERQIFRPQLTVAGEYNRFASFNNYSQFYNNFQNNNFGIGIQIKIPLFDVSLKAKANQSAADAVHAAAQADQARDTAHEQTRQLQKSLAELGAQKRVAQLQADLAQEQLEAIQTQLTNGSGSPNAAAVTPKDEQQAHIQERQRYEEVLDANFAVIRAELSLLRSIGTIEGWAKSVTHP